MEFVQSLRPEHLQSFWYFASKYCFAIVGTYISLLWVTAQDKDEADQYKAKLDEYRWTLRLSSKSADFLEQAISMLATSTGILVKSIPDTPNVDFILNRYKRRMWNAPPSSAPTHSDNVSKTHSTVYQSESELPDGTSPDNVVGETPSESGGVTSANGDWNTDHLWFASAMGSGHGGNYDGGENNGGTDLSNAFLQISELGDLPNEYSFQA
jgi:hypothetical protein